MRFQTVSSTISSDLAPAPAKYRVVVNQDKCRQLAAFIKSHTIPVDREDTSLPWMSSQQVGNFYLLLVAICHQTSPRGKLPLEGDIGTRHLRGWDYLSAKLQDAAKQDPHLINPRSWAKITPEDVQRIFHDKNLGDRLTDPQGRAILIQDLGQQMLHRAWDCADDLYAASKGRIAGARTTLLNLLSQFRAYNDPVHKKSFFFLSVMHNTGLWNYADPDQLGAPVDYHEVRGHLRIGTVDICDPLLRSKLNEGKEVTPEEDISIRKAVFNAVMTISECSGLRNPSQLHYMFWNIFRSCCSRDNTHCHGCPSDCALPSRYVPLALDKTGRHCAFATICASAGQSKKLLEHNFETDYY